MSAIETVRAGVITAFNAAGTGYFGTAYPFTAGAKWFDPKDHSDEDLAVIVLGDGHRKSRLARDRQQIEIDVICHVTQKLQTDAIAEVDALVDLIEAMEQYYYETARISTVKGTLQTSTLQLPSRKQLNQSARFYAWARLTFICVNQN